MAAEGIIEKLFSKVIVSKLFQLSREVLPMFAILLLRWLPLQYVFFVLLFILI